MSTEKKVAENLDEIKEEVITKSTPEKKPRKTREKVRDIEEIAKLPLTKLSDKEKDKLINHFKNEVAKAAVQVNAYKENAETFIQDRNKIADQYDAMEKFYRRKLQYVEAQLNAFHAAINEAIKGGTL